MPGATSYHVWFTDIGKVVADEDERRRRARVLRVPPRADLHRIRSLACSRRPDDVRHDPFESPRVDVRPVEQGEHVDEPGRQLRAAEARVCGLGRWCREHDRRRARSSTDAGLHVLRRPGGWRLVHPVPRLRLQRQPVRQRDLPRRHRRQSQLRPAHHRPARAPAVGAGPARRRRRRTFPTARKARPSWRTPQASRRRRATRLLPPPHPARRSPERPRPRPGRDARSQPAVASRAHRCTGGSLGQRLAARSLLLDGRSRRRDGCQHQVDDLDGRRSAGLVTITVASIAGISKGSTLTIGSGETAELALVDSVAGST